MVERNLLCFLFAKPLCQRLIGHVDPTPYASDFFPRSGGRVTKITPMNVVYRRTFVLDLLRHLAIFALLDILSDLQAIVANALRRNVRLVPRPCHATPTEKAIFHAVTHG